MPRRPAQPTPAELAILRVLWRRGRCTVRDVLDALNTSRPPDSPAGYTTVLGNPGMGDYGKFQPGPGNSMGYDDLKVIEARKFLQSVTQGVAVEVGERQAAIDLDVVTYYGQSIVEVTEAIRSNVIDRVESMTGLEVVEVNIAVADLHVEGEPEEPKESRVQ